MNDLTKFNLQRFLIEKGLNKCSLRAGEKSWVYDIAKTRLPLFPTYLERGRDVERGVHPAEGVEDVVLDAGAHVLIFLKKYRVNIKRWESVCAGSSIIFLPSE